MPSENSKMSADDFKKINGIGPAIERRLHDSGIQTYAQLASKTPDELFKIFENRAGMSADRINQQDWIGQAQKLVQQKPVTKNRDSVKAPGNGQHYAAFTIKLLLDKRNNVRSTTIAQVGKDQQKWAGWDEEKIISFIVQQGGLNQSLPKPKQETIEKSQGNDTPSNLSDQATTISKFTVKVCAKNKTKLPHCPYEQVVVDQHFEQGSINLNGTIIRDSLDKQLNENVMILVDNQPVYSSFDQQGSGKTQLFGPIDIQVAAGNHRIVIRHADDSDNPKTPGSIDVDMEVKFRSKNENKEAALTPDLTLEVSKADIEEVGGSRPSNILGIDQNWSINIEWILFGASKNQLHGTWLVRGYLESMGPGQEYTLPLKEAAKIPLNSGVLKEDNSFVYEHKINISPRDIQAGVYKLVVTVSRDSEGSTSDNLVGFLEGAMLQLYDQLPTQ